MLVEALGFLAAALIHFGFVITGYEHLQAHIAEGVIIAAQQGAPADVLASRARRLSLGISRPKLPPVLATPFIRANGRHHD
jgi:hypothetical protein